MSNLTRFEFDHQEIRFVGTADDPWWVAQDVCRAIELTNTSKSLSRLDSDEKMGITLSYTDKLGRKQETEVLAINESGLYSLILRSKKESAKKFKKWITSEVLPSIRKTGNYSVVEQRKSDRDKLELQLAPIPTIEDIGQGGRIAKEFFGEAYAQRFVMQKMKINHPRLAFDGVLPQERTSLQAEALLTPTKIASELRWYYSSGNPDARKVNIMLEHLGYQVKVAGQWSATDKAINANLCDRKPVETNSRTQKDQLMWSSKVIDILREHAIADL